MAMQEVQRAPSISPIEGRAMLEVSNGGQEMTPDYKFYLTGKLRGLERAQTIVNRRSADPATVRWLAKEIEEVKRKMEEEE